MRRNHLPHIIMVCFALAFISLNPSGAFAFPGEEKVIDRELLVQAKGIGKSDVIVVLSAGDTLPQAKGSIPAAKQLDGLWQEVISMVDKKALEPLARLDNVPIFLAKASYEGITRLAALDQVATIESNKPMEFHTRQGIALVNPVTHGQTGGGKGVAIAVVDSGVNYLHPALGGANFPNSKVIGGYDFGDRDYDPLDDVLGHGTSCAAIAAGSYQRVGDYHGGVAPEARIYALKIADSFGGLRAFGAIMAWDWCITHQYDDPENPIMIISNSFGISIAMGNFCDRFSPAMAMVANLAVSRGMAVFQSSGNDASKKGINFHSCLSNTISVGAVYDSDVNAFITRRCRDDVTGPDLVTCYSNSASILDLLAPSNMASVPTIPESAYRSNFGGTSAACPYAAGAAAVIQSYSKNRLGRFLSVAELRTLMSKSGHRVLDARSNFQTPRVDIGAAIQMLSSAAQKSGSKSKLASGQPEPAHVEKGRYETILDWD